MTQKSPSIGRLLTVSFVLPVANLTQEKVQSVGGLGRWWFSVECSPIKPDSTYRDQQNDIQETAFNNMFKPFDTSNQGAPKSTAVVKRIFTMDWSKFAKDGDAEQYYYTRLMYEGQEMQVDIGTINASTTSMHGIFAPDNVTIIAKGGFTPQNQRRPLVLNAVTVSAAQPV